jgi:glycosyltransferase involved in cell wall biosynthesis
MKPLVSCILVTRDRRHFFAKALAYYQSQTYPNSELLVIDDGDDPVGDLCQGLPGLTYIRLGQRTPTGAKLNLGIEVGRGEILQKMDDDDYYGSEFLAEGVGRLLRVAEPNPLVAWCCFGVFIAGETELFYSGHGWAAGGTLCFFRELWKRHAFREVFRSSDSWFLRDNRPSIARVCCAAQYVVCRHERNTWIRLKGYDSPETYFRRRRFPQTLEQTVGSEHAGFYRSLGRAGGARNG